MTWREEAKELGIALYDHDWKRPRKKADVLADIEAKKVPEKPEPIKVLIEAKEADAICHKVLRDIAIERGLDGDKEITCERWGVNCKRKGIIFRGLPKCQQ